MRPIDDPSFLTPDERRSEVAAILAAGVLRLRARAALPGDDPAAEKPPESGLTGLEVPEETVLSVHNGLRLSRTSDKESDACTST